MKFGNASQYPQTPRKSLAKPDDLLKNKNGHGSYVTIFILFGVRVVRTVRRRRTGSDRALVPMSERERVEWVRERVSEGESRRTDPPSLHILIGGLLV